MAGRLKQDGQRALWPGVLRSKTHPTSLPSCCPCSSLTNQEQMCPKLGSTTGSLSLPRPPSPAVASVGCSHNHMGSLETGPLAQVRPPKRAGEVGDVKRRDGCRSTDPDKLSAPRDARKRSKPLCYTFPYEWLEKLSNYNLRQQLSVYD